MFEASRDYYQDQASQSFTPWSVILDKTSPSQSALLKTATLDDIDCQKSYFALKWNFQMSLSTKITDKQCAKHPNLLIYYNFVLEESPGQFSKIQPFGMVSQSHAGL